MRIDGYGSVDRTRSISFRFNGKTYQGYFGDTLASALLANDVKLFGRSFKYHRPRGVLTAGPEEPNALVTLMRGNAGEPNMRATQLELYSGLEAHAQNAFPSLRFDLLAVNDLFAPFLGAGFYYKTFMWPRAFWERVYEPLIRRAAGLGRLDKTADDDAYEKAFAFCDVLVIGSGPSGLMAALTAARAGARVILAEQDFSLGGRLLSSTERIGEQGARDWLNAAEEELRALPNVTIMTRTTITGAYDHGVYGAYERVSEHLGPSDQALPRGAFWRITAKQTILAAGALERPIAFPNNDRPGIMLASAMQSYLHRFGVVPGRNVSLFVNNDEGLRFAQELVDAGVTLAAVVDSREDGPELDNIPLYRGWHVVDTEGRFGVKSITLRKDGNELHIFTDCLGVSGGWNPNVHLTAHLNKRPVWREDIAAFVPAKQAVPGLHICGATAGEFSTRSALQSGYDKAVAVLDVLGVRPAPLSDPIDAENRPYNIAPLWDVTGKARAWLDFQNDVTTKDVRQAAQEGYRSVEHMKRYTTQGMATDQGKNSNIGALAVLADATGHSISETGTTTFRPPAVPVPLAALGAGARGKGFAPERLTTSDRAARKAGAPMIEAGLWYRPSYFPIAGETHWRQSCDREVRMVREAVGVADVSTLGKIDVQGRDAARFLDLVYSNMMSTLKPGRVRYGLMLREDGFVMDDGTAARLSETQFLVTTTTAAAGQVMAHMEFIRQTMVPNLDVTLTSVTEQWAQFAVAGPKARQVLEDVLGHQLSNTDWPFMSCGTVALSGVAARLFRISFSGETGYEIAVPARFGASLWRALLDAAKPYGGAAYGMEALNVLRIEKGFITHSEIHGRVTAADIGLGRMVSAKKDCVGKRMSQREGLVAEAEREQLVGVKPLDVGGNLAAGGHLFAQNAEATRVNSAGYLTSVGYSPTLGCDLALGFLRNGRARIGERMRMVDHLRDAEVMVEICDAQFFDPAGERLRG